MSISGPLAVEPDDAVGGHVSVESLPRSIRNVRAPRQADWRYQLSRRLAVTDVLILVAATSVAVVLRFGFNSTAATRGPWTVMSYQSFGAVIAFGWWAALAMFNTRDPRLLGDGLMEYRRVVRATLMAFGCLAILSVLLKWDVSRGFLAITLPLGLVGLLASRKCWRMWLCHQRKQGRNVSRALVVGSPHAALRLIRSFNHDPEVGVAVAGVWVPGDSADSQRHQDMPDASVPVMGGEHDILSALAASDADTVIVTDSQHLGPEGMRELTWQLEGIDVDLMVSPNLVDISAPRMYLGAVGNEPFIHLEQPQYEEAGNALKGFFDAFMGVILFVIAAPILVAAAIAIKVTSTGPVLFFQTRVGRGGVPFQMIKLRTMQADADHRLADLMNEQRGEITPLFKVEDDPRITRIGRHLRRYSIDELPQLINVVKGDMSLVGPRPQRAFEVSMYDRKAVRRLTVRPGMTGLWQVSGRSNLDWEQSVKLDLYYVENWSMTGDIIILWRTLRAVFARDGAF